ncbi:MAG TPA: HD domain-containing protein [Cyclobacteriaceae bacterium]|nr:HD domain-containing protein [Cyclobacteriaceae bacterium]
MNKNKIINDPIYGFISIKSEKMFDLIEHPFLQRMRHIRQLGLAELVYPGAIHTRFHHALGAMHLMGQALTILRTKGVDLTDEECEAAQIATLLHDTGHGPFSHALEETLLAQIKHESISFLFMKELNRQFGGSLGLVVKIFQNTYAKKFLHQLVSSQLDIDRLDYLNRDSFFTGVREGAVGTDRIIAMLNVSKGQLVVEEKGIYNIESFLNARRLMYWQVYLHKTSVAAERLLVNIIKRAQYLAASGEVLPASEALSLFINNRFSLEDFSEKKNLLLAFGSLDDNDVWGAVKHWQSHRDPVLSRLCRMLLERKLFQIRLSTEPIVKSDVEKVKDAIAREWKLAKRDAPYLFSHGTVSNEAYLSERNSIQILMKTGELVDVAQASDLPNIKAMSKIVKKNYLCWPKNLSL